MKFRSLLLKEDFSRRLTNWSEGNVRDFPWRRTQDLYRILVAELLLRRTTAHAVERCYQEVVREFPTLIALSKADELKLLRLLRPLGLKSRSTAMKAVANEILTRFGRIPTNEKELQSVRWIGSYTCAAVLCMGKNLPLPMVDSGVKRVISRYCNDANLSLDDVISILKPVMSHTENRKILNVALIDLSALICRPVSPRCASCPLCEGCQWDEKNLSKTCQSK